MGPVSLGDAPPGTQRGELVLSGLSCPACVRTVDEALRGVPGVESASVNLATVHAFVDYDSSRTSLVAIHDAIKKAGYRVGVEGSLRGVVNAVQISRATMRNVYQNLTVLYPLFDILLSPLLATLVMSFSSVTVIGNANRLKRWRPS